ncbi:MAG: hypothetical protein RI894_980 [Bacteroidota bacterium]|jgi:3-hydroxyacyl-CoA dehydrogenase/enoyl-CoA hydratase/3-hydroxybutyryl-CoA epimerase
MLKTLRGSYVLQNLFYKKIMIKYKKTTENIVTITMDMDGRSANVINHEIGRAFVPCIEHLRKEKAANALKGVIITSAKKTFLAGGDLDYLYHANDPQEIFAFSQQLKALFRTIEELNVPVVAAINGAAVGGGYELTAACHYRICVDHIDAKIGLPEVTLGLLPGGGGCIRLAWLLGIEKAFQILTEGKNYSPKEAKTLGLIDDIQPSYEAVLDRAADWIRKNPNARQPWDMPDAKIPGGTANSPKIAQFIASAIAILTHKTRNNYPAPLAIAAVLTEGTIVDFETAQRIESRYFTTLVCGQTSKNMQRAFWFDMNSIKDGLSRPKGFGKFRPRKIGVIGAGMMGSGIAFMASWAGLEVVLKDVSKTIADKGKDYSASLVTNRVKEGKMTQFDANTLINRIKTTENYADFEGCDLVIEAVFENIQLKNRVTKETEQYLDSDSIFASNTSTLPITGLAKASVRPENYIGLHFFSPVHSMRLVEIIKGAKTSGETLARAFDFVKLLHKIPIVVNDKRGFYTTRVVSTYLLEGILLLVEGQHAMRIESAGMNAGMPVGPLVLCDEVSLSLILDIEDQAKIASEEAIEPTVHQLATQFIDRMVHEFNRTGKAHGAGFYDYPTEGKKHLWAELQTHIPLNKNVIPDRDLQERLLFVQILETVKCVEENVVMHTADANIGSVFGWGFAPFKGGTLQYINDYGLDNFISRCGELEKMYGTRFTAPHLLLEMRAKNETF